MPPPPPAPSGCWVVSFSSPSEVHVRMQPGWAPSPLPTSLGHPSIWSLLNALWLSPTHRLPTRLQGPRHGGPLISSVCDHSWLSHCFSKNPSQSLLALPVFKPLLKYPWSVTGERGRWGPYPYMSWRVQKQHTKLYEKEQRVFTNMPLLLSRNNHDIRRWRLSSVKNKCWSTEYVGPSGSEPPGETVCACACACVKSPPG